MESESLIEAKDTRGCRDAVRIREQCSEHKVARDPVEERALVIAFDEGAGVFDELAVFDGGRAGGFAGAAVEAFIDMLDERIGDRCVEAGTDGSELPTVRRFWLLDFGDLALRDMDHLMDAAARGIGFQVPEAIGGARVEAQAAVDAAGVVFVSGNLAGNGWRVVHDLL